VLICENVLVVILYVTEVTWMRKV